MTLVNYLIKQANADPPPKELAINSGQVRKLAAHAYSIMWDGPNKPTLERIEEMIREGKLHMCGIRVKVV